MVRTQDPNTCREILNDGVNIYPLLSMDIQLINSIRRNTTATILEKLHFYPTMNDVYAAGAPDLLKCPIPKTFKEFQLYLASLKQNRWESIKKLAESNEKKMELLNCKNDSLSDRELFTLANSMKQEVFNIEYENLRLAKESNFISLTIPKPIKLPNIRKSLDETQEERDFLHACKPIEECVKASERPFWRDGVDFMHKQEHVLYKLAEEQARFVWKTERQEDKDLNIHLPVSIDYLEWKENQERLKKRDIKINYQHIVTKLDHLTEEVEIEDILLDQKIRKEEKRLKEEIKKNLRQFWLLQKEKKTVSDGDLFDLSMINERCLPIINTLMAEPKSDPKVKIHTASPPPQLAIGPSNQPIKRDSDEWSAEWSD